LSSFINRAMPEYPKILQLT